MLRTLSLALKSPSLLPMAYKEHHWVQKKENMYKQRDELQDIVIEKARIIDRIKWTKLRYYEEYEKYQSLLQQNQELNNTFRKLINPPSSLTVIKPILEKADKILDGNPDSTKMLKLNRTRLESCQEHGNFYYTYSVGNDITNARLDELYEQLDGFRGTVASKPKQSYNEGIGQILGGITGIAVFSIFAASSFC